MNLAIVTLYDNQAKSYGEITADGKERYCKLWGYKFKMWDSVFDLSVPASWSKLQAILCAMELYPDVTHFFWSDADSLIREVTTPLHKFIDWRYQLQVSNDDYGLNFGNFLIRNTEWSRTLIKRIRAYEWPKDLYWEQSALRHFLDVQPEQRAHIRYMGDAFNNYPSQPRGFMLHCTSMTHPARFDMISEEASRIAWPSS